MIWSVGFCPPFCLFLSFFFLIYLQHPNAHLALTWMENIVCCFIVRCNLQHPHKKKNKENTKFPISFKNDESPSSHA
jgi:hypothetical protein